jgi:hypothetical protein
MQATKEWIEEMGKELYFESEYRHINVEIWIAFTLLLLINLI